jgi:hypothetical protein
MSISDITVDTNVLIHACNPSEARCDHSIKFLTALNGSTARLAIDRGFATDQSTNSSLIGAEYWGKLVPGTLSYAVIVNLALTQRICIREAKLPLHHNKRLNQMVSNKRDRTFIKVCFNSEGKTLVSHDYADFSVSKRKDIASFFEVNIIEASEGIDLL